MMIELCTCSYGLVILPIILRKLSFVHFLEELKTPYFSKAVFFKYTTFVITY